MTSPKPLWRRLLRWLLLVLAALITLFLSGLLLADHLTPKSVGDGSSALPIAALDTSIDRQLQPLLAAHPGQTGVGFLAEGLDAYAARALVTRHAGRSLDLQYYIWHDDLIGHLLARELYDAAERGVRVRLLLDDMNTGNLDPGLMALDAHPNIELRMYNPFRNRNGIWRIIEMVQRAYSVNHRMHNKSWIADGRVAIVGGRNIGEEYFSAREDVNFKDLDLLLAGPAVQQASDIFDAYWNSDTAVPIRKLNTDAPERLQALLRKAQYDQKLATAQPYLQRVQESGAMQSYYKDSIALHWTAQVKVVSDPPQKHKRDDRSDWLVSHLAQSLRSAQHKALLISPYFVPGEEGAASISQMAQRGVHVGVITNSLAANDVAAVHSGYMRYRPGLLRAGVHMHELKARGDTESGGLFGSSGASLHTKAFLVDDQRGFVGSFNLDPRSVYLNTEMGVLFDDPVLGARLRDEYLRLASPAQSYWVFMDDRQRLRWLDRDQQPPALLTAEPDTHWWQRNMARMIGWLPIESQL